jgi:tryptophan synthase alpha chain
VDIILALGESGADVIEVGLPFSDPLADGPTIQMSSKIALDNGVNKTVVFEMISEVSGRLTSPIVLMTYCNPVLKTGPRDFASRAREAGVAGVIVPDLPVDEADEWIDAAADHGLDTIFLAAPTTTAERMKEIVSRTTGFLYYVSTTGVTGSGFEISDEMVNHIRQTRELSSVPVAVGFGICTPKQAGALAQTADGVIVGSALIREIASHDDASAQVAAVKKLAGSLSAALRSSNGRNIGRSQL